MYKVKFIWLGTTRKAFDTIWSRHFTENEIVEYKLRLLDRIENKITLMKTSMPVNRSDWHGSYKIIIDKFVVYYSFSDDQNICYIEYFKHMSQIHERREF
jgi:mRNA-degrading endonuclease RelE of RelBE toxin-antitoxin system